MTEKEKNDIVNAVWNHLGIIDAATLREWFDTFHKFTDALEKGARVKRDGLALVATVTDGVDVAVPR